MRRVSLFLLFLIFGSLVIVATSARADIPGQWTYPGWQYRVPITIYNPNSYSLTNYQLELEINSSWPIWGHVSENGSDIRFATADGSIISYYIESWNYSAKTATIWIKVPSLPALSYTTIYMYYGNPNATSESDPNKVFIWFDNASTDRSTDYEFIDLFNNGVSATLIWEQDNNRYLLNWSTSDTNGLVIKNLTLQDAEIDITFTLPNYIPSPGTFGANIQFGAVIRYSTNGVYYLRYETYPSPDDLTIMKEVNPPTTTEYNLATYSYSGDNDIAGKAVEIRAWARGYYLGMWSSVGNATLTAEDHDFVSGQWGIWFGYDSIQYIYIDKIVVRAYADKVPSYRVGVEQVYKPPVSVTLVFKDDAGNTLDDVFLYVNGTLVGLVDSGTVLNLYPAQYSFTLSKQHYITSTAKVFVNSSGTLVLNLTRESYTVKFYAYTTNGTDLDNFTVYANGTLLGTFSSGEIALVKYGTYIFKFEKDGYRSTYLTQTIDTAGEQVIFMNIMPANVYSLTLTFYDAINNTELNNVSVSVDGVKHVLDSGSSLTLTEGNYTLTFSKPGYENNTLRIELTGDTILTVYLQPSSSQPDINLVNSTELVKNITSYVSITPINPYAKAFMDSGGSFGDTIKLALKGDSLMRFILPQVLILAIVIVVLVQTTSPLAALGGALIGWAMSLGILGEAPSLRNSGMTFMLVVFLVAWTLWDLFYNYSRET